MNLGTIFKSILAAKATTFLTRKAVASPLLLVAAGAGALLYRNHQRRRAVASPYFT